MLCDKCPRLTTCRKLCPKAEKYVSQDEVDQHDIQHSQLVLPNSTVTEAYLNAGMMALGDESTPSVSPDDFASPLVGDRENLIRYQHDIEGRKKCDIAKALGLKADNVRQIYKRASDLVGGGLTAKWDEKSRKTGRKKVMKRKQ